MKKIWFTVYASLFAFAALFVGCNSETVDNLEPKDDTVENTDGETGKDNTDKKEAKERKSIELTPEIRAVANSLSGFYTTFTTDMVGYAAANPEKVESGNVVVSPLSMAMLLSMVANGVDPGQQYDFTEYLGTGDMASLNEICRIFMDALPEADNLATFRLANSIWIDSLAGLTLTDSYDSMLRGGYDAEIRYESFSDNKIVDMINGWCSEKTQGLIPDFLRQNPEGITMLLNALYFKNSWMGEIFSPDRTTDGVFHGMAGNQNVKMMESAPHEGLYAKMDNLEFFTLSFGNGAFQIEIVLPEEGNSDVIPTEETLRKIQKAASYWPIIITLPKFKVDNRYPISDMFAAMGRKQLTDGVVINMFEGGERTVDIRYSQATSFSVDEEGAEIAAITGAEIDGSAEPSEYSPIQIRVDRPFWFFVKEFSTRACILSGRIANL